MVGAREIPEYLGPIGYNAMYLPQLVRQCQTGGIVPFVGAGLSAPLGFPQWGPFLLGAANSDDLRRAVQARLDALQYEEAASLVREGLGWRLFDDLLRHAYGDERLPAGPLTGALAQLPKFSGPLVTTNFDRVLETAFERAGARLVPVWHSQAVKGAEALQRNEAFLLKLHGDWADAENRVLTKEEYRAAYGGDDPDQIDNQLPVPQLLNILLASRSCVFLGCSLKQDRTMILLKAIADVYKTTHYAAIARPADDRGFEIRTRELSDLGICPIWYPAGEHGVLAPLLEYLAARSSGPARATMPSAPRREPPNNLPHPTTPIVGRVEEVQQVVTMFRGARLVTLLGGGGCGKSRMAIEVALTLCHQFPEGAWFVDLASLSEKADKENLLPARIGGIAGIPQQPSQPPLEALVERFSTGKHLLVLDNCEHLVSSCTALLRELVPQCAGLSVLTTSRISLKLADERIYPLATLRVPPPDASRAEIEANESVTLFRARAGASFQITETNASAVAELCRALDGIPLAIEVAAARLGVRSVQQMSMQSKRLLDVLEGVEVDDLRHWHTVTAALEWSFQLLPRHVQPFLRSLSIFDGGWTEEWASALHGGRHKTAAMLQALLDASIIIAQPDGDVARFRFLEPVRQFVRAKLTPKQIAKYERAHAVIFRDLAERARLLGSEQAKWLRVLQDEVENLRAALRWCVDHGETETALRITGHVWRFWEIRGYFTEGRERAATVLSMPGTSSFREPLEKVLSGAGWLAYRQADFAAAESLMSQALALSEQLGLTTEVANATNDLGNIARIRGEYTLAAERLGKALEMERRGGSPRMIAVILYNLGAVALDEGDLGRASMRLAESLDAFREQQNAREIAFPLRSLAEVALLRGNASLARDYAAESLELREQLQDSKGRADTGCTLAWVEMEDGDMAAASRRLAESLNFAKAIGDRRTICDALEIAALVHARLTHEATAVQLIAGSAHLRDRIGFAVPPVKKVLLDGVTDRARQRLGPAGFDELWQRGQSRSVNALIDLALQPVTS